MQTLNALLALLAVAAAAAAEAPVSPGAAPTPQFNTSDEVPELTGSDDAFALYEIRVGGQVLSEADQIKRWQDELKAGRARAGTLAGSHLAYLALNASDCALARDTLLRADELGHDQAALKLAELAENTSCGDPDIAAVERWLKKAVTLDYFVAAQKLMGFYSSSGLHADPVQQYIYARVAAGYWEAVYPTETSTSGKAGFDASALQEMEKSLSANDRKHAETEAAQILAQMLKRHQRFTKVSPQEFSSGGQAAKTSKGYGFVAWTSDYHHECAWNLVANCRGAQRLAYVDVNNNESEFMSCKAELRAKDFVTNVVSTLPREMLIGPKTTRRLILGDVNEQPDKSAMTVVCKVMPKLIENAAAGRCKAKLQGTIDAQQFYPASAQQQGIQGDAVVRFFVAPGGDAPVDAEIARSSGYTSLDEAAIDTIRSGRFTKECDYAISSIRIAFKLQD
jgi:TonB family protein